MNWTSQDLLDEPLQQEEAAARDTCWLAVCSQYVKCSERGLWKRAAPVTPWGWPAGMAATVPGTDVGAALLVLVVLPLLKMKAGTYFEVKGSLCF